MIRIHVKPPARKPQATGSTNQVRLNDLAKQLTLSLSLSLPLSAIFGMQGSFSAVLSFSATATPESAWNKMSHQERTAVLEELLRQPQQQIHRKIGRLKSQLLMSILSAILTEQITLRGACRADAGTAESAQNEACPKGFQKSGEASAC